MSQAARMSRLYPPIQHDANGLLTLVEQVNFAPAVCSGLNQCYLHIRLPSIFFHETDVPPVDTLPTLPNCAYVHIRGLLPPVMALRIDLFPIQQYLI